MDEHISVREWQERFKNGTFANAEQAGWNDFLYPEEDRSAQALAHLAMRITHPFILDQYYLEFSQHFTDSGRAYGDVCSTPLNEDIGNRFLVFLDSPRGRAKWSLVTIRFGAGGPEFECGNVQKMSGHINHTLGPELEQGIKPPFIAEKFAVEVYAGICGEPSSPRVYREGEHCYSYTSFLDGRQRVAMTSARAEDVPPGFVSGEIRGVYVWHVESAEKQRILSQTKPRKSSKRKEAER